MKMDLKNKTRGLFWNPRIKIICLISKKEIYIIIDANFIKFNEEDDKEMNKNKNIANSITSSYQIINSFQNGQLLNDNDIY